MAFKLSYSLASFVASSVSRVLTSFPKKNSKKLSLKKQKKLPLQLRDRTLWAKVVLQSVQFVDPTPDQTTNKQTNYIVASSVSSVQTSFSKKITLKNLHIS